MGPNADGPSMYEHSRKYWNEEAPEVALEEEHFFKGPVGDYRVRFFYPQKEKKKLPCIVFIHGGGFTVGSIESHEGIVKRLVNETGAMVASIDYHLAPKYKYPVQLKECIALIKELHAGAGDYGIDQNRISVGGDSAGAHLSLAVALKLRDEQETIQLQSMLLYYGSYGLEDSRSMRLYGGDFDGMKLEDLKYYIAAYVNEEDKEDPYRNLLNSKLTYGLPPAYIMACDLDPLYDDSLLLKEIFEEHGIEHVFETYHGVIHGFLHYSRRLDEAFQAIRSSADFHKGLQG
ncbi:MAG TPA: acetyl esterase [Eubacteriaceae bacterium]|nr:acetyl esterase [Eubacteriaceae bacterium]